MAGKTLARLAALLLPVLAAISMQPGGAMVASASTADGGTAMDLTTRVLHWHGTVLPGNSNVGAGTLRCLSVNPTTDDFAFNLTGVDSALFAAHRVTLTIRIDWTPVTNPASNNLYLTTYMTDAAGTITNIRDANQLNTTYQAVGYANPPSAAGQVQWHAGACAGTNSNPQDYTGTATLTINPLARTDNVSVGSQLAQVYRNTVQNRDALQRPNAGEPNLGSNFETGNTMYMAGSQVSRISWNDSVSPPAATWTDVTPPQEPVNEDNILFTDRLTGRTWAVGLLVATSNINYTDSDGTAGYQQGTAPVPHSPDHETLGSGPFPPGMSGSYPRAVYYCSQNINQGIGAFCGASSDGGVTYAPSTLAFGPGSGCGAIHGHIRVAPDGTAYLPQKQCGLGEGMAVSRDLGQTWTYPVVPDSSSPGGTGSDPSVMAGARNTVYYAYSDAARHLMVATSSDHGKPGTWTTSTDLGAAFGLANAEFPEVVTGDDNRAAVAFIGSTTRGDDQAPKTSCTGSSTPVTCSANTDYFKGAWDLYIAYTYDGGATWQTTKVPGGPIQRGCVWLAGGGQPCRNMLDFNEITVDKQGRVLVSYTDGCTATCKTSPTIDDSGCGTSENAPADSTPTCTFARVSMVARQYCGRGLFAQYDGALQGNCFTQATNLSNPSPVSAGGSGLPPTSTAMPLASRLPVGWALLPLLPAGATALVLRRRRRRV